jgi:hypothetical protein
LLGVVFSLRIIYNHNGKPKGGKMEQEEKKEKLLFLQRFFAKSFWLSFVFLLIATALCIFMHDSQVAFVTKYFPLDDVRDYNYLVILILGIWKILIFQFTLVPALVIWCMRHCCKCGCSKES